MDTGRLSNLRDGNHDPGVKTKTVCANVKHNRYIHPIFRSILSHGKSLYGHIMFDMVRTAFSY